MKTLKMALLLVLGALLVAGISALPAPVAAYGFESAAGSVSGTFYGKAAIASGGVSGSALRLVKDPSTYVSLGKSFGFEGQDFSLSFWVRMKRGYADQMSFIISRHDAGWANGYFVQVNAQSGIGADNKLSFYYSGSWVVSKTTINDGEWHHVGVVYRRFSGAELFIDGKKEAAGPAAAITVPDAQFLIGGLAWWGGTPVGNFEGEVDELALFGQALSEQEMASLASVTQEVGTASGGILRILMKNGPALEIPLDQIRAMEFAD